MTRDAGGTSGVTSSQRFTTGRAVHPVGAVLALLAAAWHAALMSSATNDNFLHLTLAQQWLAGDWPVRDFFEHAWVLQYTLSAAAQILAGHRLLGETLVVGLAWAVSTYVVFHLTRRLTGSTTVAALASLLLIVSSARGYSYPKGIVYAVTALLWWAYVQTPTRRRAVGFGAWAAIAFYWRPDHGVYVAIALALAVLVAHGIRMVSVSRCSAAGTMMLALIAPFLIFVHVTVGLPEYVQTGVVQAQVEHLSHGTHEWPLLRFRGNLFTIEPAENYAPTVTVRWSASSSQEDRRRILTRYGLTPVASEDGPVVRVRLLEGALTNIRALINEPVVEDTAGIDRSTATLDPSAWPASHRRAFRYPWLRVQVLPFLDKQARASEFAVALFHLLPIVVVMAAPWVARHLPGQVTTPQLVAFALFAFLIDVAMLRNPFPARVADAVVLSAIVFAFCLAALWRAARESGYVRGGLLRIVAVAVAAAMTTTLAEAGQFTERVAGQWTSLRRAREAWGALYDELAASPPLRYYVGRRARFSLRLAAYVRECTTPSDRLLVLWFEPEIYYYSDRLMAQRHLGFAPAWAELAHEQRMTLEKVKRYSPPLALARRSALDAYARATFPGLIDYVNAEYRLAAVIPEGGEEYLLFARRDRPAVRKFGPQNWPCYVRETSQWSRVGTPASE